MPIRPPALAGISVDPSHLPVETDAVAKSLSSLAPLASPAKPPTIALGPPLTPPAKPPTSAAGALDSTVPVQDESTIRLPTAPARPPTDVSPLALDIATTL